MQQHEQATKLFKISEAKLSKNLTTGHKESVAIAAVT